MNKKNGFTLIELLAVIVILAVIVLIVTPVVTNIIKQTKDSADLRSAESYVSAANNFYSATLLDASKASMLGNNVLDELDVSGKKATGSVVVNSNGTIEMAIVINNKCYKKKASQTIQEIEVSSDADSCGLPTIGKQLLKNITYLELGENGCKTPGSNNYTYMGGCYIKGKPNNNYVWYSGFLWRIMGINADGTIRMVTEETVSNVPYDDNSTAFSGSNIEEWLNVYFMGNLRKTDIIKDGTWCVDRSQNSDSARTTCSSKVTSKIGIPSLDEFNLGGKISSTLFNTQMFWLTNAWDNSNEWYVTGFSSSTEKAWTATYGVRPVINIDPNTAIFDGNGIINTEWNDDHKPYVINDSKPVSNNLKDKTTGGEYIKLANKLYRVVSKDTEGNTKLIYDGYYKPSSIFTMTYGSDNVFSTTAGVGLKLNTDVLEWLIPSTDATNRNKLVTDYIWYQNTYIAGNDYKVSLNEATPTRTAKATVGLIRVTELLSGVSQSILSNNSTGISTYDNSIQSWLLDSDVSSTYAWFNVRDGRSYKDTITRSYALRPVIVVKNDIQITGGEGTPSSPYEI